MAGLTLLRRFGGVLLPSHAIICELLQRDEAQRAVTQLLGWVVSSRCLAEISTPAAASSLYSGLFVCFCPDAQNKNSSVECCGEASVRGRAVMTEERCAKVEQYVGEIKGGLRPAMKLTVIGMVHSNPKSFSVTLLCDPVDANKDVGMLFTVNFSEKSITRNARIGGKWGREEKTIPYFPFTAGDTFKMELLCEHQQIRVLLDGRQLCDFTHRIQPLNLVKALQISGDIKLTKVA